MSIEACKAQLQPHQSLKKTAADAKENNSKINQKSSTLTFDAQNFAADLEFTLKDGKIISTVSGQYVIATIKNNKCKGKKIAITLKPDYSRGAQEGDVFAIKEDSLAYTFSAQEKLPEVKVDINELKQHLNHLQQKKIDSNIFIASDKNINKPKATSKQSLKSLIDQYVESADRFMRKGNYVLSESHGCIHITPKDGKLLKQYLGKGSKITIQKYSERPTANLQLLPYLRPPKENGKINHTKIQIEVFPKTGENQGGRLIVYYNNTALGYIKITGGPEQKRMEADGYQATPTRATRATIKKVGWHKSGRYVDSRIPGGSQIRSSNKMVSLSVKGKTVKVPLLEYRVFNYKSGKHTDTWKKVPNDLLTDMYDSQNLLNAQLNSEYKFDAPPFETRIIKGKPIVYYIGSSFGNGEVGPTGERFPQKTFDFGTPEKIHSGGVEETNWFNYKKAGMQFFKSNQTANQFINTKIGSKKGIWKYYNDKVSTGRLRHLSRELRNSKECRKRLVTELQDNGYLNDNGQVTNKFDPKAGLKLDWNYIGIKDPGGIKNNEKKLVGLLLTYRTRSKDQSRLKSYLNGITELKNNIFKQSKALGIKDNDVNSIVSLMVRGYQKVGQEMLAELLQAPQQRYFIDRQKLLAQGRLEVENVTVKVSEENGKLRLSLSSSSGSPKDIQTTYNQFKKVAKKLGKPYIIPKTTAEFAKLYCNAKGTRLSLLINKKTFV
ncbi:hypothetical protein ACFL52_01660 [Candidatus Margulisiibacteriota bacterium]